MFSVCELGGRLIAKSRIMDNGTIQCHKNTTGPLYKLYCGQNSSSEACDFFTSNNVSKFPAIPGLASNMFYGESLLNRDPSITEFSSASNGLSNK